jgi:hypothetical protein
MLLLGHRYKHYTVVITIWLPITKYPYLKGQLIFSFLRRLFCFFYHRQDFYRTWLYMSNTTVSYKKQERLTLREHMGSPPVFGGVSVPHLFIILCWVVFLCFICLHPVSYVPNVASFSGLFILTLPLRFSLTFIVPVLF